MDDLITSCLNLLFAELSTTYLLLRPHDFILVIEFIFLIWNANHIGGLRLLESVQRRRTKETQGL